MIFKRLIKSRETILVEPLRQEPEAPFQNATSRDWQKAFNPQRELGAFCSGVIRQSTQMKLIGIKYCGGCNPIIDRVKLVQEIKRLLPPEYSLTTHPSSTPWDTGILICGCLTACADKPEFKNLARKWIVVAGNSVDLDNAPEEALADIVVRKLV